MRPGSHIFLKDDSHISVKGGCEDVLLQVDMWKTPTDSRVGLKVTVVDGLDQLLGDFNDLLLPG